MVQGWSRQIAGKTLSQKYPTKKRAGGVAQVEKHLPSKCEVLSSNSSTTKNNSNNNNKGWEGKNENPMTGEKYTS
jgi:hypothetical protein